MVYNNEFSIPSSIKLIALFVLAMLIIFSCGSDKKKLALEKKIADSIQQVQNLKYEKQLADSLFQIEKAMTVYGGIRFGMKKDTVMLIMKKTLDRGRSKILGAYTYSFSPFFNDSGQLYMLQLETESESSLELESIVRSEVENLKQIICYQYGEPLRKNSYPDDFVFVENQLQWIYRWEYETKTIKIGVAAIPEGSRYKAICQIYNNPLWTTHTGKSKDLMEEKIKKAASNF